MKTNYDPDDLRVDGYGIAIGIFALVCFLWSVFA